MDELFSNCGVVCYCRRKILLYENLCRICENRIFVTCCGYSQKFFYNTCRVVSLAQRAIFGRNVLCNYYIHIDQNRIFWWSVELSTFFYILYKRFQSFSRLSSMIRRINSLTVMLNLLASTLSHLNWGGVKTTDRWMIFMKGYNTLNCGAVN
jgi:hypothetical protein